MDFLILGILFLFFSCLGLWSLKQNEKRERERRFDELKQKGVSCNYDDILADIKKRDHADETRKIAPLKPAADSVIIDTSEMNEDQVIEAIKKLYEERRSEK